MAKVVSGKISEFSHYMLKEIFEQPEIARKIFSTYLDGVKFKTRLEAHDKAIKSAKKAERVFIIGCGSSYHAGLYAEYLFPEIAKIPAEAVLAHELRSLQKPIGKGTLVIALSQSGETADTFEAAKFAKKQGAFLLAITNSPSSRLARLASTHLPLQAGEEKSITATKSFSAQLLVLVLVAVYLGRARKLSRPAARRIARELSVLPEKMEKILRSNLNIQIMANKFYKKNDFLVLGRKYSFPLALEAALKMKESGYLHAEGLAAGELEHGPLAALDNTFPAILISPLDSAYKQNFNLIEKLKKLRKKVIAITTQGNRQLVSRTTAAVYIPQAPEYLTPLFALIPLQLFAYHLSVLRGLNPDKPRHLTKFVS